MIKYVETLVTFAEIPDEVTLCINISNCPHLCQGCHSPWLREDIGTELTGGELLKLIERNKGISCVCIMGGDSNPEYVDYLARIIKNSGLKSAWYSGSDEINPIINVFNFNYIKIGHYDEDKGPINKETTNQKLFKVNTFISDIGETFELENITYKFWND